jgi:hypothetical protein
LIDLVLRVLRKIVDSNAEKETTYRKVLYAKEVQKELNRIVEGAGSDVKRGIKAAYILSEL